MKNGIIIKSTGKWYTVMDDDGCKYPAVLKGKHRIRGVSSTNPLVVGDKVFFHIDNDTGIIEDLEERKNYLIRKSTKLSKKTHIIAANVDQAILIITLKQPETSIEFIDRFLVSAEAYSIPTLIVINKSDLYTNDEMAEGKNIEDIYNNIGYSCFSTSAVTGNNMELFKESLKNKTSVLSGPSGVGKSTLINTIDPGINLKTGDISSYYNTGKHITTFAEMIPLHSGGFIIDTPGIRGFGLVDIGKEELYHYFPEIFNIASECKFHNCTHTNEPGCAVIKAVKDGEISESRYTSYRRIYEDEQEKYR